MSVPSEILQDLTLQFIGTIIQGPQGPQGKDGPPGTNGTNGTDGTNGTKGDKGDPGEPGLAGVNGINGINGTDGADGAPGKSAYQVAVSHGFSGTELQWLASLRGTDGKSFEVSSTGSLANQSNYDNQLPGFSFLDTDAGNLYIRQSSVPGVWSPPVPFGKGEKGDKGDKGEDGADGVNGVDGKSIELSKSPTAIQWRQVDETWQNLVLLADITGPQGPQGIPGVNGTDGVDGAPGTPSVTNFMSKGSQGAGTQTFDVSAASMQGMTVTGSITIALTGWPAADVLGELCIELVNGGAFVITWPATVRWIRPDGTFTTNFLAAQQPLLASGTDFVFLWSRDGGSTIWGKVLR